MSHSYVSAWYHCVFSTKGRTPSINQEIKERLLAYMGGIARENQMEPLAIGGTDNHVHMLVSLPSRLSISEAMKRIKGGSSTWVHETFKGSRSFGWQEGYGAFCVSASNLEKTKRYIESQEEHHRKYTFEDEYMKILEMHGLGDDVKYVFG